MTARSRYFAPLLLFASVLAPVVRGEGMSAEDVFAVGTSAGVGIDTRTDEAHWIAPGTVEELYGEAAWTAPNKAGTYSLTHEGDGGMWTARYEVVGEGVEVVGDADLTADATWGADKTWLVTGTVRVGEGATLTIESGATVLQGPGGSILSGGGAVSMEGAKVTQQDAAAVRTQSGGGGVCIDTRTEETHWIAPGTVEELYGEVAWTAPSKAGSYALTHDGDGGTWTARYEVAGDAFEVVGDVDLTSDATWGADKTWLVTGTVRVGEGATLAIESGATILQGPGGSILSGGGAVSMDEVTVASLDSSVVRTGSAGDGVRVDTRTDETHWIAAGTVEELYGEAAWTAPNKAGAYALTHEGDGGTWTAKYEVVGEGVEVVGDVDLASDATWGADKTWIVAGTVRVGDGATLTIESGATVLQGPGGAILSGGGVVSMEGASISPFDAAAVRTQSAGEGVRIDTRTDETHWIAAGTVEEMYGEVAWTAPAKAGTYALTHDGDGGTWTARYEVVGDGVEVVGDVDLTTDAAWGADKEWLVTGTVRVGEGATLAIASGATVLQGPGGSILSGGGAVSMDGVTVAPLDSSAVRTGSAGDGVRVDTRTDETHWIAAGTVEELYGEAAWMAPAKAGTYALTHDGDGATWTAKYEVVGEGVEVVGDVDLTTDAAWGVDKTWIVAGTVRVGEGATLTIENGAMVLQGPGGSILSGGGAVSMDGATIAQFDAAAVRTQAEGAGTRIDTRTDETHWIMGGTVEELYGEAPWTAPSKAGVYALTHDGDGATWTARYEVAGETFVVVGDLDVEADTTWSVDKTWLVTGTVVVKPGATLTVESGANAIFDVAGSLLNGGGTVAAEGAVFANRVVDGFLKYGGASTDGVFLDTTAGEVQVAEGAQQITYGTEWGATPAASVAVTCTGPDEVRRTLVEASGPVEGEVEWTPEGPGGYDLRHVAGEETLEARFVVPDLETTVVVKGGSIVGDVEWGAGKTILVTGPVVVEKGASLTIERGTVVKFMDGAGLDCASGGSCVAEGVVFTHVNDDTAGGDTMFDGESEPVVGGYTIGNIQIDEVTQLRYYPTTVETLSGTISANETWRGWNVYRVTGNLTIASGATLTINPGAVVKFDAGVSLTVNSGGTLNALGTRAQPIVFTSVKDDEHGGDTNGDGDATTAQPGDWKKIAVYGTANFEYAKVHYASSGTSTDDAILVSGGSVAFNDSELAFGQMYAVGVESGHFCATNSVIREFYCAFRHWPNDPFVNGVIYNCNRLSNNNGQKLYNSVVVGVTEAWDWSSGSGNTYGHCLFWNEPGMGLQGLPGSASAANGNIWGNPLFLDADGGDFRVADGSPCVDAGDTAMAPETDYFGQPRASAFGEAVADIGIYEVQPRGVAGDVDLVAVSVSADAEATPGGELRVCWEVGNRGGKMAVGARRDAVSLVSAGGREVALGEKVFTQNVAAGGTAKCEAGFRVPPVAEGTWWPKVVVNSQQDIFEGSLISNNARTGEVGVEVSIPATVAAAGASGTVAAGVPTVLKLHFGEGDGNRMVVLGVPAGVSVAWGFGFVPAAGGTTGTGGTSGTSGISGASGTAESAGTPVQFVAPDGVEDVYIVLESGEAGAYEVSTESGKLAVTAVEPGEVPSSGEATLAVSGAGFMPGAAVKLKGSGATIAAESVRVVDSRTISATLDCGKLAAGAAYDLVVESADATATAGKAVHVAAAQGVAWLELRLDVPDSARQGRVAVGYVECANTGNADMDVPVFAVVSRPGDVSLRGCEATNQGWTNALWLVGISSSYPKGTLKPGDRARIPFEFMVTGSYRMELVKLDASSPLARESVFPSWAEFSAAIASASTALNGTEGRISDYGILYDYAIKAGYGGRCGVVRGVLLGDANGAPMPGRSVVAVEPDGIVADRAVTDENGVFVFSSLVPTNSYAIAGAGVESSTVGGVVPGTGVAPEITLFGHDFATVRAVICANGERLPEEAATGVAPVLYSENGARWPAEPVCENGVYLFGGVPDGTYTLVAECGGDTYWTASTNTLVTVTCGRGGEDEACVPIERCGRVRLHLEKDGVPAAGVECHADFADSDGVVPSGIDATTGEDGVAIFNLKPGVWRLSVSDGYSFASGDEINVEAVLESETEVSRDVKFTPFSAFPDVGPYPLAVSFFPDFLPDPDAVASWAWDFDGDGIADSGEAAPSYTYTTPGRKAVTLTVLYTNGTSVSYSADAVDVWDEEFVELETSTLLLDAASGYRIVSRAEGTLVLEYTREAVPADLAAVETIVIPGEEMSPLGVCSWSETDGRIVVHTEASSPVLAYRSMRMAGVTAFGARGEPICSFKDKPVGPYTFTTELCTDGKWRKRGTQQTRRGVALEIEWNTGTINYLQAIEKDENGKIEFWETRFKGRWEPEATIGGEFELEGQKNRTGRGVKGDPYKPLSVDDQLLFLVAGVPICYSAGAEFSATASLGGEIAIRPAFDVDVGYRYAPGLGNKGFKTFRRLDDGRGLALHGKGELDLYAGLFFEIYAGANKKAGKKEFGLKICDINVGGGLAAKASMKISADEFEPDEYSLGFYGRFKFEFAPMEVNLGLWKFKPFNFGWHPEKEIVKRELKTPVPRLSIIHEGSTGTGEEVTFENLTDYGQWIGSESLLNDGDNQFVNLPKDEQYRHVYTALPGDTRKYEVKLQERYAYFWGLVPILTAHKANSYTITVHGRDETIPINRVEVSGGKVPQSCDPNEMAGPLGAGAARLVAPGEWMTYTVYFENKGDATAAAQEVTVTEQLSGALDWGTFEMVDVGFNNQLDLGLGGKRKGASETAMTGTAYKVRTELDFDEKTGAAKWYMRIVDERTETRWPRDVYAGFLPPNDATGRGEGHITYRVKLRDDAAAGTVVRASANIVFDYNAAIETDPAWWNTVAEMGTATVDLGNGVETNVSVMVGAPWAGQLPDPGKREGMRFAGWFTGPDGTGEEVTEESVAAAGAKLYAFWDGTAAEELWLDVSWGSVEIGTNGVVKGYGRDGEAAAGMANRYVLTGMSTVHGVKFAGGSFTNTWTNLVVDLSAKDAVGVALEGAQVEVTLEGDNFAGSGEDCAGIRVDEGSALVLDGPGRLASRGGAHGAGIGGGLEQKSGRIEIRGGTVEAKGGDSAAGIGGGLVGSGAEVVVTGGSVKARGDRGEDIGNGYGEAAGGAPKDGVGAPVYEVEVPFAAETEELPVVVAVDLGGGRTYQYAGPGHEGDTSLWFWLPEGTYDFEADGDDYGAHVEGAKVAAVFTDPGSAHFEAPAVELVEASEEGWRVGLNPAFRTTPFVLWTATGLDEARRDWAWEEVAPSTCRIDAETGAVEWTGPRETGLRVFKFQFLPKE